MRKLIAIAAALALGGCSIIDWGEANRVAFGWIPRQGEQAVRILKDCILEFAGVESDAALLRCVVALKGSPADQEFEIFTSDPKRVRRLRAMSSKAAKRRGRGKASRKISVTLGPPLLSARSLTTSRVALEVLTVN